MARKSTVRATLLSMTALAAGLLASAPAHAQTSTQIDAIQRQIRQLQRELTQMKHALHTRDAAVRAAQAEANRARREARQAHEAVERIPINPFPAPLAPRPGPGQITGLAPAPQGPASMAGPSPAMITQTAPRPVFQVGGLTVSLGGFVAFEGVFRSRNESASIGSSFGGIPFNNVPAAHMGEFHFTAQQSRVAALVEGNVNPVTHIAGYVEADFLGAAPTANNNESNSYNPRLRQFWGAYDRTDLGLHLVFGQMWSLVTLYKNGLIPRKEDAPLTIDAQYVPGFTWKRQAAIRVYGDFMDKKVWLGASLENPETTFFVGPNGSGQPSGTTITTTLPGTANYGGGSSYSSDVAPDMVLKAAFEPGYGHYEVYGLGRLEKDRVSTPGFGANKIRFGGGVGGGFIVPLLHNTVQLQGSALVGAGIGSYGTSGLPDATIGSNGQPVPVPEVQALVGLIGHPSKSIDIYGYVGTEQESRKSFSLAGKGYGYGSPLYDNSGCQIELSTLPCSPANTSGVVQGTVGFWWRWLHGPWGTMATGAQVPLIRAATSSAASAQRRVRTKTCSF